MTTPEEQEQCEAFFREQLIDAKAELERERLHVERFHELSCEVNALVIFLHAVEARRSAAVSAITEEVRE